LKLNHESKNTKKLSFHFQLDSGVGILWWTKKLFYDRFLWSIYIKNKAKLVILLLSLRISNYGSLSHTFSSSTMVSFSVIHSSPSHKSCPFPRATASSFLTLSCSYNLCTQKPPWTAVHCLYHDGDAYFRTACPNCSHTHDQHNDHIPSLPSISCISLTVYEWQLRIYGGDIHRKIEREMRMSGENHNRCILKFIRMKQNSKNNNKK